MPAKRHDYNERLFKNGLRSRWHLARFLWLEKAINDLNIKAGSVVELGCYDGKTINFIHPAPIYYVGYDANWEGGLDIARRIWKTNNYKFYPCSHPSEIKNVESFDIAICMETLEHVPPELIEPYIKKLSELTNNYLFVTVPVEKGPVFFIKYIGKMIFKYNPESYTFKEFMWASIGLTKYVHRNQHKGFDYNQIIKSISKHFEIVKVEPHPIGFLPKILGIGIGIVAKKENPEGPIPIT